MDGPSDPGRKAVCQQHAQCICWINLHSLGKNREDSSYDALLNNFLTWIVCGIGDTKANHQKAAAKLKAAYGVKPG